MIHIQKRRGWESSKLTEFKSKENEDWTPTYEGLETAVKEQIKEDLIKEQKGLCCYCEVELEISDSHIEHVKPQCLFNDLALNFENLACSCQRNLKKGEPRHCGNLKEDWYEEELFVSPFDEGCGDRFDYGFDGTISPADSDDEAARTTIAKLGLGIDKLNALRRDAIEPFLDGSLTEDELKEFVKYYLKPTNEGYLDQFYSTIKHLFS